MKKSIFFNPNRIVVKAMALMACLCFLWQDMVWAAGGDFLRQRQFYVKSDASASGETATAGMAGKNTPVSTKEKPHTDQWATQPHPVQNTDTKDGPRRQISNEPIHYVAERSSRYVWLLATAVLGAAFFVVLSILQYFFPNVFDQLTNMLYRSFFGIDTDELFKMTSFGIISTKPPSAAVPSGPGDDTGTTAASAGAQAEVTYFSIRHHTAVDFRRHLGELEEARGRAKKKGHRFAVIVDGGAPANLPKELTDTPSEILKSAYEQKQVMQFLKQYFESQRRLIRSIYKELSNGNLPPQSLLNKQSGFAKALFRWAATTRTRLIPEDFRFEDWLMLHSAGESLSSAQDVWQKTGLIDTDDQQRFFQYMEENIRVMVQHFKDRNSRIVEQVIEQAGRRRSFALLYGAGHIGVSEAFKDKGINFCVSSSSVPQEPQAWGVTGLAGFIASGIEVNRDTRELIYLKEIVRRMIRIFARIRGRRKNYVAINEMASKIAERWNKDEILEYTKLYKTSEKQAIYYLAQWLYENCTAEERRFLKVPSNVDTAHASSDDTVTAAASGKFGASMVIASTITYTYRYKIAIEKAMRRARKKQIESALLAAIPLIVPSTMPKLTALVIDKDVNGIDEIKGFLTNEFGLLDRNITTEIIDRDLTEEELTKQRKRAFDFVIYRLPQGGYLFMNEAAGDIKVERLSIEDEKLLDYVVEVSL